MIGGGGWDSIVLRSRGGGWAAITLSSIVGGPVGTVAEEVDESVSRGPGMEGTGWTPSLGIRFRTSTGRCRSVVLEVISSSSICVEIT